MTPTSGLFALIVESENPHFPQPLLNHLVNQTVVPNESSLVLGRVLALWTLVDIPLLNSLTETLPEMTVSKMPKEHVASAKIAAAKRAALAV